MLCRDIIKFIDMILNNMTNTEKSTYLPGISDDLFISEIDWSTIIQSTAPRRPIILLSSGIKKLLGNKKLTDTIIKIVDINKL